MFQLNRALVVPPMVLLLVLGMAFFPVPNDPNVQLEDQVAIQHQIDPPSDPCVNYYAAIKTGEVAPGGGVTYEITVYNCADSAAWVSFQAADSGNGDSDCQGWNWNVVPNPVLVADGDSSDVELNVTAPQGTADGDYCEYTLTASMAGTGEPATYEHDFRTNVVEDTGSGNPVFCVEFDPDTDSHSTADLQADPSVELSFDVNNCGTATITVQLFFDENPDTEEECPPSWSCDVEPSSLNLPPGGSEEVFVNITVPSDSSATSQDERVILNASVTNNNGDSSARKNIYVEVPEVQDLTFSVTPTAENVEPTVEYSFAMTVVNRGNSHDRVTFQSSITTSGVPDNKVTRTFEPAFLELDVDEQGSSTAKLTADASLTEGEQIVVQLKARVDGTTYEVTQDITLTIRQLHAVTLSASPGTLNIDPGVGHNVNVQVTNNGNGDDTVQLLINSSHEGWSFQFSEPSVSLSPAQSQTVALTVTAPTNAVAGVPVQIAIDSRSGGMDHPDEILTVTVNTFYDLRLELLADSVKINPGRTVDIPITVANDGNIEDEVLLISVFDQPGWSVNFFDEFHTAIQPPVLIDIAPREEMRLFVNLTAPTTADPSASPAFTIEASSGGNSQERETVVFTAEVTDSVFSFTAAQVEPEDLGALVLMAPGGAVFLQFEVVNTAHRIAGGSTFNEIGLRVEGLEETWSSSIVGDDRSDFLNNKTDAGVDCQSGDPCISLGTTAPEDTGLIGSLIQGPADTIEGQTYDLSIIVFSTFDGVQQSEFSYTIAIQVSHAVELRVLNGKESQSILEDEEATYQIAVENVGNVEELVHISIDEEAVGKGWKARLGDDEKYLEAGEVWIVLLTVIPPDGVAVGDSMEVVVVGELDYDRDIRDHATTKTTITENPIFRSPAFRAAMFGMGGLLVLGAIVAYLLISAKSRKRDEEEAAASPRVSVTPKPAVEDDVAGADLDTALDEVNDEEEILAAVAI